MPLADPILPNLAIEQLAQIARAAALECDVFYGTLRLSPTVPLSFIHTMAAQPIFGPAYHGVDEVAFLDEVADEIMTIVAEKGTPDFDRDSVMVQLLDYEFEARRCIERCLDDIPEGRYDVVGFSIGFDSQKLPSALLAKLLREREPGLRVIFGGTGCDGAMARACLEAFPEVDAVMDGEAIESFVPAVRWLRAPGRAPKPAALAVRDGAAAEATQPSTGPIDGIPDPDYRSFIAQKDRSEYRDRGLTLFFETSRGCWWGRKHHCTFCGIKTVSDPWRSTDADEALRRIVGLYGAYGPDLLYCVDAILDRDHMKTVLPVLADARARDGAGPALFYEVKSNLKRRDVELLAAAGVTRIQPGIENFSSRVLDAMRKGVRGLRQVAVLKWCAAYDVRLIYGYLAGIPEERPDDVWRAVELITRLHHLPPPVAVNMMSLHRFSPYHREPERYRIAGIQPFKLQCLIYRRPDDVLMDLCYELDFRPPWADDPDHRAAHRALRRAVTDWQIAYGRGHRLIAREGGDGGLIVLRANPIAAPELFRLTGDRMRLYRAIDEPAPLDVAARRADVDISRARADWDFFVRHGLAAEMDGEVLALAVSGASDAEESSVGASTPAKADPAFA